MESIIDSIPLPTQLLPCLAIPFVELFPNLCLGWFTPPSLNLAQYKKMWYLRISLQSIAWYPIFETLFPIRSDDGQFSLLVIGTVACIVARTLLMEKQIDRVITTPLWATLPREKREALYVVITSARPSDINKFDEMAARYVSLPTKLAPAVIYGIVTMIHKHLGGEDQMKLMGALAAFTVGGIGIGGTRHGSWTMDHIFRCIFGAGFIAILHYLAEASDVVLMKSIE